MDQQPSHHARDGQDRSWTQEGHFAQCSEEQNPSMTYGPADPQDKMHSAHQQIPYQNWYHGSDAHMHTNYEGAPQTQWATYASPAVGEYYNQQIQIPYYPPPYVSQPVPQEQAPALHSSWPDNRSTEGELRRYVHAQYPSQTSAQNEQYATSSSLPEANLVPSVPHAMRGRRRERPGVLARSSSQTFGPYTSTSLRSRDASPTSASAAEFITSRIHTPPEAPSAHGSLQPAPTAEPSTRATETSQFVVPSSRIPRTEVSPHSTLNSQPSTPRTSHSPEISTETKPKRRRANVMQLRVLNETYDRTMFPTTEERAEIARRINMTPRQVQIWFQNRRQATRQAQVPDSPVSFGSQDPGISQHGLSGPPSAASEHHEGSRSYRISEPPHTKREDA
ncbi:homeobox domain protein [Ceratobasidium sp. AG-Ba]|nr:homeobox domain protein [Ceratobasidium sp. AG-Ba]QRW11263.1 homeobox domain protein [Ceratobasidium sp. AG-Ba]